MDTVNYLATLWGLSLVLIPFALLINEKFLKQIFAEIENGTSLFFWGMVSLIIGLAMILSYNVWAQGWQVIITILGWLALLKGLALLYIPEQMKKWAKKLETSSYLSYALIVLILIGLVVTYFGFTA